MFPRLLNILREYRLYLLLCVLMIGFTFITGFNGLYGQDSYEYLRFSSALIEFVKHGTDTGKDYWPVLYPICGALLAVIFKPLFALQLISVVALILSGIYLEKILRMLYKEETRLIRFFVFLFFLLSPYLLRASLTVMADSLCLLFITSASYCFLKYKQEKNDRFFIGFAILATSAIATRYAALIVLIVPIICVAYYFFKKFSLRSFLIAGLGVLLILLPYVLVHKNSYSDFFNLWLKGWSYKNFFHSDFTAADGHQVYTFPNILFCFFNLFHPAYCFAGILFIVITLWSFLKRKIITVPWVFIISLILYAFFLAGFPFQDLRHLILSFPFVLIAFFPGFVEVYKRARPRLFAITILLCVCIQLAFFIRVFIPFYHYNKIEKQISSVLVPYDTATTTTLYTFSIDAALKHYGYSGRIINMWEVKLDTLPDKDKTALVLFNEKQFAEVWKNKNPMLNWQYLNTRYRLIKIKDLPDNWNLYMLQSNKD